MSFSSVIRLHMFPLNLGAKSQNTDAILNLLIWCNVGQNAAELRLIDLGWSLQESPVSMRRSLMLAKIKKWRRSNNASRRGFATCRWVWTVMRGQADPMVFPGIHIFTATTYSHTSFFLLICCHLCSLVTCSFLLCLLCHLVSGYLSVNTSIHDYSRTGSHQDYYQ